MRPGGSKKLRAAVLHSDDEFMRANHKMDRKLAGEAMASKPRPRAQPICTRAVALKMFREEYLPKIGTTTHNIAGLWGAFLDRMVDEGIISAKQARRWAPPSEAR